MKLLRPAAAAALVFAALSVAVALADTTPLAALFNVDNLPNVTLGTAQTAQSATGCGNVNGVSVSGAGTGSAPTIATASCPNGTGDTNQALQVQGAGTGIVKLGQAICSASGASPQTCNGQRGIVTTASLSTAAATDATFTINDSSVSASSLIECAVSSYSGTYSTNGDPIIESCVPGSGTFTVNLRNVNATNALSGTVGIGFVVLN